MGTILPGKEENSFAVASSVSNDRLAMTTFAPASANRRVMALPMPRQPPVTMAVLSFRLMLALTRMRIFAKQRRLQTKSRANPKIRWGGGSDASLPQSSPLNAALATFVGNLGQSFDLRRRPRGP